MALLLKNALNGDNDEETPQVTEEKPIKANLREISSLGEVFIDFSPQTVSVPEDWKNLWDLNEREKMSPEARKIFEETLLDLLSVEFIRNSDELPQKYFISNLTDFTESGIRINMNFSDPILVSQSEDADQVKIRIKKDFFMTPIS